MKKFMKNVLFVSFMFIMSLTAIMITFPSCEKVDPRPACEIGNYGSVTVKNSTGYNVWVDVTWGNVVENYEKLLYNGNTYKYNEVPAGSIEIWVSFDGNDWYYEYEGLSACEAMTYTWYLTSKKSANGCPFVLILPDGKEVTPTMKEKI